jgi:hypothetical protein
VAACCEAVFSEPLLIEAITARLTLINDVGGGALVDGGQVAVVPGFLIEPTCEDLVRCGRQRDLLI